MKSGILKRLYKDWTVTTSTEQIEFVDNVYDMCETHYSSGGNVIIECFAPEEIVEQFKTMDDVKEFIGLKLEQALNARCGEDSDWELTTYKRFKEWANEEVL